MVGNLNFKLERRVNTNIRIWVRHSFCIILQLSFLLEDNGNEYLKFGLWPER